MVKKLFTQIKNEWRGNLWLLAELLVVSVVMWFVVAILYHQISIYLEPRGFDTEHCYNLMLGELSEKSPDFKPYDTHAQRAADIRELVERLRRRPEVEAVSLSVNSYPYNGSNGFIGVGHDTISPVYCIRRYVTPDFVRVFRYRGTRGETPEQLAEILRRGELLVSDNLYEGSHHISLTSLVGKDFHFNGDTTTLYKLGASLVPVRYHDFMPAHESLSMVYNLDKRGDDWIDTTCELCVRVKADQDKDFIGQLRADCEKQFRIGNIYIAEIVSFKDVRRTFQQIYTNDLRNHVAGIGFLLINIFLGLLGSFWYRTQQRRGEIALHMVHGATPRQVFGRLMAEGVLLLVIATLPALVIDCALAFFEVTVSFDWGITTLSVCALITAFFILLMMLIGIGIPARKAMQVHPVEALHNE